MGPVNEVQRIYWNFEYILFQNTCKFLFRKLLENKWFPFHHIKTGIIVDVWPPLPAVTLKSCHNVINESSYLCLETHVLILDHVVFSRFSARAAARSLWSKLWIPETKTFFRQKPLRGIHTPSPYRWETSKQCAHSMGKMMTQNRVAEFWKQGLNKSEHQHGWYLYSKHEAIASSWFPFHEDWKQRAWFGRSTQHRSN